MLCLMTPDQKTNTRLLLESLVEKSEANPQVLKKLELAKGMVVWAEGRALIQICPKCQTQFKTWRPQNIFCSDNCLSKRTSEERFWEKVDKNGPIPGRYPELGPCWIWTAANSKGYGAIRDGNRNYVATHLSWKIHHGAVPDGKILLHKCDNPPCVNPDHLIPGTHRENVHDCMTKGRFKARGELNGQTRLNNDQVIAMRLLYIQNYFGYFRIARLFNISQACAYRIVNSVDWNHLPSREFLLAQRDKWINTEPILEGKPFN